jgi:hypothetical protein
MTINATQRFPMDQLLQCGQCGAPMHLEDRPGPVYTCAGSSNQKEPCQAPALRAADLNRHLLGQVMSVIITDSTFHTVREAVGGALAEAGHDATEADELCRNAASVPEWLMTAEQAPEGGEVLARFIDRIRVEPGTAEVEYRLPLPAGTPLAGTLRQTISLPESLLA